MNLRRQGLASLGTLFSDTVKKILLTTGTKSTRICECAQKKKKEKENLAKWFICKYTIFYAYQTWLHQRKIKG